MAKAKKPFSDIFSKYKTYDPSVEGYGSESEWGKAFDERMGVEEAAAALGDDNPLTILGFKKMPTMDALKTAYRKLIRIHHPDFGGTDEMARRIIAAYSILEDRIRRSTK